MPHRRRPVEMAGPAERTGGRRPVLRPLIVALALAASAGPATAQPAAAPALLPIDSAATELSRIERALPDATDHADRAEAGALRDRAAAIARLARTHAAGLEDELKTLDASAALLGPPLRGIAEAPDIRARRREMARQHGALDSAIKRTRLVAIQADQLVARIDRGEALAFSAMLSTRRDSPLLPAFWRPVAAQFPADLRRIERLMAAQADATRRGLGGPNLWAAILGIMIAVALFVPVRVFLARAGQRVMIDHAPASRLRRSGLALWLVALGTIAPWLGSIALVEGFDAAGMIDPAWHPLARQFELAALMAALIRALGGALLQYRQPSWRLLPASDLTVERLRPWVTAATVIVSFSILFAGLGDAARVSAAGSSAGDLLLTGLHLGLIGGMLLVTGRIRIVRSAATAEDTRDDRGLAGVALVALVSWVAVGVAVVATVVGYIAFGLTLSRLLLWLPTVAAAAYLLLLAVDDLCTELISGKTAVGRTMHDAFGVRHSVVDQTGVALSAILRVVLIVGAIGVAFAPFGSNFGALIDTTARLGNGVTVGEVTIAPMAVLRAIMVLALGLFAVRAVERWLTGSYLPTTELDAGARNSISTVASYLGIILVGLWTLTALGIGLERVALILSALSVGIGFGLQAITQNFVSGLVLLIERPIKIGDLIRVGDQEGDVKRINVRATEIVVADKSTLIVPNSELITRTVRNMTLADPIGRVQIRFNVPPEADVELVRTTMLTLFADAPEVLEEPAPKMFLDSLTDGAAHFNAVGYVRSPRQAYETRSDLLFALIGALKARGIELSGPPPSPRASPGDSPNRGDE